MCGRYVLKAPEKSCSSNFRSNKTPPTTTSWAKLQHRAHRARVSPRRRDRQGLQGGAPAAGAPVGTLTGPAGDRASVTALVRRSVIDWSRCGEQVF